MWHYPIGISGIDNDDVLIFGGQYKEILRFNYESKEIQIIKKYTETSSPIASPNTSPVGSP